MYGDNQITDNHIRSAHTLQGTHSSYYYMRPCFVDIAGIGCMGYSDGTWGFVVVRRYPNCLLLIIPGRASCLLFVDVVVDFK